MTNNTEITSTSNTQEEMSLFHRLADEGRALVATISEFHKCYEFLSEGEFQPDDIMFMQRILPVMTNTKEMLDDAITMATVNLKITERGIEKHDCMTIITEH